MHWLREFLKWHPSMAGAIVMYTANAVVTNMPSPDAASGKFYIWAFNTLHSLVGAIPRIVAQYKTNGAMK